MVKYKLFSKSLKPPKNFRFPLISDDVSIFNPLSNIHKNDYFKNSLDYNNINDTNSNFYLNFFNNNSFFDSQFSGSIYFNFNNNFL